MQKIIDAELAYKGFSDCDCVCRLRVWEAPDRPTVVILTELPKNRGTSVTNMVDQLATEVYKLLEKPARGVVWIEHAVYPEYGSYRYAEMYDAVTFTREGERFVNPAWSSMTLSAVEAVIGQPIENVRV